MPLPHRYQVFSVGVEHLLLLRKGKPMLPLLQKQKERPKLPLLLDGGLPLRKELEKPLLLDGGLPLLPLLEELEKLLLRDRELNGLGVKLNGDVENRPLPVKEPSLLERDEFVGLGVELRRSLGNLDSVGLGVELNELSGVGVVERLGVGVVGVVERLDGSVGGGVVERLDGSVGGGVVSHQRHL